MIGIKDFFGRGSKQKAKAYAKKHGGSVRRQGKNVIKGKSRRTGGKGRKFVKRTHFYRVVGSSKKRTRRPVARPLEFFR